MVRGALARVPEIRPDKRDWRIASAVAALIAAGPLATILVQRGTLRVGDVFVAGASSGKVRAMIDDHGRQVKEAPPSLPVEVLGLSGVPSAGDVLSVV